MVYILVPIGACLLHAMPLWYKVKGHNDLLDCLSNWIRLLDDWLLSPQMERPLSHCVTALQYGYNIDHVYIAHTHTHTHTHTSLPFLHINSWIGLGLVAGKNRGESLRKGLKNNIVIAWIHV